MKVYKGKLNPNTAQLIKENQSSVKRGLGIPSFLGKPATKTYSIAESIAKYNAGLTLDEIKAWVWYRRKKGIPMYAWNNYFVNDSNRQLIEWVKKGILFIEDNNYVPYPIFTFGNIYTKIALVKKSKDFIINNFGTSVYENHLDILEKSKPKTLSISNPVENERPVILAISKYTREFTINNLRASTGVILEETETLVDAFRKYLKALPDGAFKKTNSNSIIRYYLNGENKPRNIDKIEWGTIQKNSRDEGESLFKIFLYEALEHTDQLKIDAHYNMNYNAVASLQYDKIPVGIEVSKSFHGFELDIRPAQREGIAFMELVGSGLIAYDVGVGKTITAIIEVASAIANGKCKRPIICVPNPTYKNWIKEMFGFDGLDGILTGTGIKLNEWYNLGAGYDMGQIDFEKAVPEKSITLVTYEGFQKLGFSENVSSTHLSELSTILSQSTSKSERDQEKEFEKFRSIIGVGQKGTIADFDKLGFDYVVIDEAHNFKNIFSEVKSDDKEDDKKRFHVKGGQPSSRGVKAFFICNYVQRTFGRNVMLLTATPFTNSPLEIYSMLSLVAYDYMKKGNIINIKDFFEQYILETTEYVVGTDGEIKQKDVVKSFNNRISLQKLINSHINFKTGEEANIPRPCKINLPKTTGRKEGKIVKLKLENQVTTYLKLTDEQQSNQQYINSEASKGADRDDPGRLLRLMSASLNNALSPFLYTKEQPIDYLDFVENSPKIQYTMDCIGTVKKWHEARNNEVTGQVIYIDRGKQFFPLIKEYLETVLGYKKGVKMNSNPKLKIDEVEVITGGMPGEKKEKIKDAFNDGSCKIIIGTSTIKEGINLQKKATCLYNLYPNWNPTDIRQLEGRIWRQKNENGYVRVVMPLMENSMDVFVFQKLEEKTSRINDLWSKSDRGNVLDEESLDPNEIKFALVTDLGVLTRFEVKQIQEELRLKDTVLKANIEALSTYNELRDQYNFNKKTLYEKLQNSVSRFGNIELFHKPNFGYVYMSNLASVEPDTFTKTELTRIESIQKSIAVVNDFLSAPSWNDAEFIRAYSSKNRLLNSSYTSYDYDYERFKDVVSRYNKIKRTIFEQRGYSEDTNLQQIQNDLQTELDLLDAEHEEAKGEGFYQKIYERVASQKEKYSLKGGDLKSKVIEFTTLNHLLSYKFKDVDHTSCSIPTVELKKTTLSTDTEKRIRIAKAKAIAIKIKLKLAA